MIDGLTEEQSSRLEFLWQCLAEGRCRQKDMDEIEKLTVLRNKAMEGKPVPDKISGRLCPADRVPKPGDWIYARTALSFDHGFDDVIGGLAEVCDVSESISGGETVHFVRTKQQGNRGGTNWEQFLAGEQEKLAKEYGGRFAHPSPDYSDYSEPGEWR